MPWLPGVGVDVGAMEEFDDEALLDPALLPLALTSCAFGQAALRHLS